jgi:hypothetical protein
MQRESSRPQKKNKISYKAYQWNNDQMKKARKLY